jgi:heme/copper-type cytochrome/quinol oxidase subunit 2
MTTKNDIAYEATMAAVGSKATYGGASTSVVSWFLSSEFGMLMGIFIGVTGLLVNWHYKHKEDKRRQEEHARKMGMYE